MKLVVEDINETAVYEFMRWQYEPPYDIYNMSVEGQTDFSDALQYFLNPEFEFHLLKSEADELVGFFSYGTDAQVPGGNYQPPAIDIGLAVRPDHTGNGLGIHFANTAVTYAIDNYSPSTLRVTIAEFNLRAQKVWHKLGFEKVDRFLASKSQRPFILMTKDVNQNG